MKRERTVVISLRCRRPQCQRIAETLGLCNSCYNVAYRLVRDGVTTWEELRRAGKIAERKRNAKDWFLAS